MVRLDKLGQTSSTKSVDKQTRTLTELMKLKVEQTVSQVEDSEESTLTKELPDEVVERVAGSGRKEVPITSVHVRPEQARKYFAPDALQRLANQIQRDGIRSALWVRPFPNKPQHYQLVAGERRYRCAEMLGMESVPVIVFSLSDEEMIEASLIENMQRQDLNPIEETEGILELLSLRLNLSRAEVVSVFNRKADEAKAKIEAPNSAVRNQWEIVEEIFSMLGRITPDAFRSHRLPLLNLPPEVLEALRQGKLEYTKARAIATIKDAEKREWLLEKAIDENLTLRQIQAEAREINQSQTVDSVDSEIKSQIQSLGKRINQSGILNNPSKKAKLEKYLAQINQLIDSN